MVHTNTGSPPHLYVVRAPAGETPFDTAAVAEVIPLRPSGRRTTLTHGNLAHAPHPLPHLLPHPEHGSDSRPGSRLAPRPDTRPALRLVPALAEPDPAEARLRSQRLAHALAEIASGRRALTQLRPYASAPVYGTTQHLIRRLAARRVGHLRVESCGGHAPAEGIAEGYARLRAPSWVLTLAFRLERDAPTRHPTNTWLCTALEHDELA
ncbi:Rv3235 family protein [Embleya sp. NPDC056575]|uniref:Rv3235 family protein n=1 Tax=unclassified Embleya TaxID=2699296 RepID=UPI0036B960E4